MDNTLKRKLSCTKRDAVCFSLVSVKERQCKFPLACILRQSWQDEVITEWLTDQHDEDLSPPGREIAKSQFTHIELRVRAWSRSCKRGSHTQTLWHCTHTNIHMLKKLHRGAAAEPQLVSFSSFFHMHACAGVSPHASTKPSFPVKHTYLHHQSVWNDSIMQVCVCEAVQQRGSKRQMTPEYYLIYIPSLNNNSPLEDGSFDPLTHRCISHAAT